MIDKERIKAAVRELLIGIGEDPDREDCLRLPTGWQGCVRKYLPDFIRTQSPL